MTISAKNIEQLKESVLDMLPIAQREIGIKLNKDHRRVSELLQAMESDKLIKKSKIIIGGKCVNLIERAKINGNGKIKAKDKFEVLLNKNQQIAPCIGCMMDPCKPTHCNDIVLWVEG